jgi:hypothetical protein
VSDIGWRVAAGQELDQFDKSFFLAYRDSTKEGGGASKYMPATSNLPLVENADTTVKDTFAQLRTVVENGPFTRFGILVSNTLPQELFAFYGPYTPILQFNTGFSVKVGNFMRLLVDETDPYTWSMEEQEDSIRMTSQMLAPDISTLLTVTQPYLVYTAQRDSLRNQSEATYKPRLDVPDAMLRMSRGFDSTTDEVEIDWFSPTRGRQISTSRGASAEVFLQDLAAKHERFGDGQVAETSLARWPLIDPDSLAAPNMRDKFRSQVDYKEKILYITPDGGEIVSEVVDMTSFYTARGEHMLRPAFTEYVAIHRNALRVEDPAAEAFIARSLNLSRNARRRSMAVIRLSHRWNFLRRLFEVEVMSWPDLMTLARVEHGTIETKEVDA